jgi:hypothetical protein
MREDYTHISFIIDRSGSMSSIKDDTIGGFNSFLEEQQAQPGKCTFSLTQFDDKIELLYSFVDIKEVPKLTDKTFVPRGWTALYDAIGITINGCGAELAGMKEEDRPGKVLVVILTDGVENYSKEFGHSKIHEMIKHQTDMYKWNFIFLGANIDAEKVGSSLGAKLGNSMTFKADGAHTDYTFKCMSASIGEIRGMSSEAYAIHTGDAGCGTFSKEDKLGAVN